MIHPYAVAGFLVAVLPLIATPGASLALLVRHVTDNGRRQALPVILGTVTGLYVHAAFAVAGLSALVMHSSQAFTAVRLTGAVYLVGLGVWTWRSASPERHVPTASRRDPRGRPDSVYAQAMLANVLNPKAASVYLTLVPQFIAPHESFGGQILTLATAHALLIALWLLAWTLLVRRASRALHKPRFKHVAVRTTAVVLLALGVRSAVA
ncbi:LysE family translocator [Streptomyces sp. NBC_00102]|uniref:LysE family translocator n=1 Tax=Streptomyces sp. NBC_00102 TaxID=2975652 RepID=UPI00225200EA|nr:LysE family translocator [Streptomyces sp. NBC_00102]MCX5399944.1 LysE family translocator [Streptomyces sp. NBC_00102]